MGTCLARSSAAVCCSERSTFARYRVSHPQVSPRNPLQRLVVLKGNTASPSLSGCRILIVEDELETAETLFSFLTLEEESSLARKS